LRRQLTVREEVWPIAGAFRISRETRLEARLVVVEIAEDGATGRGEATPYARYGETPQSVCGQIESVRAEVLGGLTREGLQKLLAAGAARNALDCALWDLEAKLTGIPVWKRAGLAPPEAVTSFFTISLDAPERMAKAASEAVAAGRGLLKLKVGGEGVVERVAAVRSAAPGARVALDANEALGLAGLRSVAPQLAALGVDVIEQPVAAGEDAALEGYATPVTLCADESLHTLAEVEACARRYQCFNIKLDKAGGLTEALALKTAARERGLKVMVGCMVATSLAMAPAMLLAQGADYVDLDGPLLLARDRTPGLRFEGARIAPPEPDLWG
jgi:L-alanine-DL-glutamate epimerase-like enolase superfamily enzyme